jgi:hypothetical protein
MGSDVIQLEESITVCIESQTEPGKIHFEVSPQLAIREFLLHVLDKLAECGNADRVKNMQNYYEPVLELCVGDTTLPLDSEMTLEQAGVENEAVCCISAKPLKERIMFCNSGQA